jgi:site-specific DNA recombinase
MKAVLFCRVSSKEQEETGYSLPAQEKYLREYAEKAVLIVDKVFAVSESASGKKQRKVFNEMLIYVRKTNISIIIAESTDRVTRNFADVPVLDKWVLEDELHQIHLAKESCILHKDSKSHEWFMWRVKVATAEYYVRLLSENVKKGQKEKIAQGWLPTKPPIGYKTIGEKGHKEHVIDEEKKHFALKLFEYYDSGEYSLRRLTEKMFKEGLRNENGNRIVKSRIHQLITDPFYIGKNRWNGIVYDGKHVPLIPPELFERVQKRLHSKGTPKYSKHLYLFNKFIHCKECKGLITWEIHKGIIYGHCNHYRPCSQRLWVTEEEVEKQLTHLFDTLQIKSKRLMEWIRKALKESYKDQSFYHASSMSEWEKQLKQAQNRLDKLYDDKVDEKITEEMHSRKFKQYTDEKNKALEMLAKHTNANNKFHQLGINFFEISQRGKQIYSKGVPEKKRILLGLVFENITLEKGVLTYDYTKPFKILSEAIHRTNSSKLLVQTAKVKNFFDPTEKVDTSIQTGAFEALRPILLRG